ncbi:U1 small nuclear ribonucleoprotein [Cryptosporidium ubiquitum]|uniref:U1 small nuclear ribonucleoprotein n=1 Tax=Cryptosporidium ubiquitum TaxID=857276 RepID=A0A1J4MFF8_9CRYT|nr:U1 small nuclear ribonucleoprotein [Cryptosporidium ubiquitum]OII72994.1 U1 small nuclear ribonucleoprotein [Cryptosporidium ubiquitum]
MSAIGMSSDLLKFFQARPPLPHIPYPKRRPHRPYQGLADLLNENPDLFDKVNPPPPEPYIDTKMRKEKQKLQRIQEYKHKMHAKVEAFNPKEENLDSKTGDPYNTLFIARLNYDTTERTLKRELEVYGNLVNLHIVKDFQGESRGYAFAEFENEESLKEAYKSFNRKIVDGWKILVDVERGRTVENWLPKRLGGGLGIVRGQEKPVQKRYSGTNNDTYYNSSKQIRSNYVNSGCGQPYRHREQTSYRGYGYKGQNDRYSHGGNYNSSRNYGNFGNKKFRYSRQGSSIPY